MALEPCGHLVLLLTKYGGHGSHGGTVGHVGHMVVGHGGAVGHDGHVVDGHAVVVHCIGMNSGQGGQEGVVVQGTWVGQGWHVKDIFALEVICNKLDASL